jgi:cysteine desulfurase
MLYFDHNATTPLLPQAREAWLEAADNYIGNPSSPHRIGQRAEAALQRAREHLAGFLGCAALDLVWTSGATESNNMVFHHAARAPLRDAEVWVSAIEHPACSQPPTNIFRAAFTSSRSRGLAWWM